MSTQASLHKNPTQPTYNSVCTDGLIVPNTFDVEAFDIR